MCYVVNSNLLFLLSRNCGSKVICCVATLSVGVALITYWLVVERVLFCCHRNGSIIRFGNEKTNFFLSPTIRSGLNILSRGFEKLWAPGDANIGAKPHATIVITWTICKIKSFERRVQYWLSLSLY